MHEIFFLICSSMENYYCAKHFICFYCGLNKHLNEILSLVIVFWCQQQVGYCVRLCVLLKKKKVKRQTL